MMRAPLLRFLVICGSVVAVLSGLCWYGLSLAQEPDSVDRDYSQELPRIPPKSPSQALGTFEVLPGFRIDQVAAEPLVEDPVAIAFDEDGRLFAVEMRDYSEQDKESLGRIRLLEDTDGDGHFDRSTIFAEGLSWPTAIICYGGGIFVGAPPHLYFLKDTDGDRKADIRQLVYTGFGRSNVQGLMNSFHWGLDNRIHLACSSSGAEIVRQAKVLEGVPGSLSSDPDATPLVLRGRDAAFDPRTLQIVPTSGGAQHGMSFNEWGEKFVCSNSDHIQQVMYEDRYLARNPYLTSAPPRQSIAADGPQADVFRRSPVEPWRIVRTRLRVKQIVPGAVEGGGRAAGYFTGATGATIYTGNAWPEEYLGMAFVGDVGSNIVHRKRFETKGLTLVAHRIDPQREFLASSDIWFRPVQFANAPDGTLYILDMYREVIEHPASLPPLIKKHLDLTSGRDRGRLYRVLPENFSQPPLPKLSQASAEELVAVLAHPNGWHRETALRLLYERQDPRTVALLDRMALEHADPRARIHALCALEGLGRLTADVLARALRDSHPRVREHAVRLSEKLAVDSAILREKLLALGNDEAIRVRYQLAFTLGELADPRRVPVLAAVLRLDPADRYIRTAALSSTATGAGELLRLLATDTGYAASAGGKETIRALAVQIGKQQRADDLATLLAFLPGVTTAAPDVMRGIVQGLAAKPGSELEKQIAAATGGRAEAVMVELLTASAKTAADLAAAPTARADAIQRLRLGRFADRAELFAALLEPTQPGEVQAAALGTLATFDDPSIATLLVAQWSKLSPRLRSTASDVMFSRSDWLAQLLAALGEGKIATGDIDPARLKLLAEHRDESVRAAAKKALSLAQTGDRAEVYESYRDCLTMKGDAARGKEVFKRVCAACHQLEGVGFPLAPNLAAMKNRGAEAILTNVLMPNREVNPQYLNYVVSLNDGRTLTGIIAAETANSITLKRAENATDVILRIDIEELRSTGVSLMPEGIEKQIDKQAMTDVIEYLKSLE